MSEEVKEVQKEEVKESRWFDNSPTTDVEERRGILDWSESITEVNLAQRALQESLVLKNLKESREAMDRLNHAAHNLNLYLISRGV